MRTATLRYVARGWRALAALGFAGVLGAGCQADPALTRPSTTGPLALESFVGTLPLGANRYYSFTVPNNGTVTATLLTLSIGGAPSTLAVTLSLGVPRGTACVSSSTVRATASATPQLNSVVVPSVYCINVFDHGDLTAPADFVVTIARPR